MKFTLIAIAAALKVGEKAPWCDACYWDGHQCVKATRTNWQTYSNVNECVDTPGYSISACKNIQTVEHCDPHFEAVPGDVYPRTLSNYFADQSGTFHKGTIVNTWFDNSHRIFNDNNY